MRSLFSICFLCLSVVAFGQNYKVPKKVKAAFSKLYPYSTKVKWSGDEPNRFEVSFRIDKDKYQAVYDSTGKHVETGKELLSVAELPYAVTEAFEKAYPKHNIYRIAEVKRHNGEKLFEIDNRGGGSIEEVYFDEKGNIKEEEDEK